MPEKFLRVAVDWDGVIFEKKGGHDPRNWAKMGLKPNPGAQRGIDMLGAEPDVQIMGIFTARPEKLRGWQTRRQQIKYGIPVENIHFGNGQYKRKMEDVLTAAAIPESLYESKLEPPQDLSRILLIDDMPTKLLESADELRNESPRYDGMLDRLTLVAFGPKNSDIQTGTVFPDSELQVVRLPLWSPIEIDTMLQDVRDHAA